MELVDARISGGFKYVDLICNGNRDLEKVKCTGFWNSLSNQIVEVSFKEIGTQIQFKYQPLKGNIRMIADHWECSIEDEFVIDW